MTIDRLDLYRQVYHRVTGRERNHVNTLPRTDLLMANMKLKLSDGSRTKPLLVHLRKPSGKGVPRLLVECHACANLVPLPFRHHKCTQL